MITIADIVMRFTAKPHVDAFRQRCQDPMAVQAELLDRILRENADCAYGQQHHFADIDGFDAFRRAIPIADYEDLRPYIDRARHGESSQLTCEDPVMFAMTSGTTGQPKYIPVTPASRDAKSHLTKTWLNALYTDHPDAFAGKILAVVSPEEEEKTPGGTPCGAESGHGYRNVSVFIKPLYSCPYSAFQIKDYDARYYTLVRIAAGQHISLIYCCNPSTILILAERLAKHADTIIDDIRQGTLHPDWDIDPDIRREIEKGLSPDPERADTLHAALQQNGRLTPANVWPDLGAVACWKGGNVQPYLERFADIFRPDQPIRDIGYLASELRGSVPLSDDTDAGPLAIETNVYEFAPADLENPPADDDPGPDPASLLTLDQLQDGQHYYVYITTLGGLYRYDMNDIVEVTGYYEQTPMIRFLQKGKGVVSFTGEKLYEQQVVQAVEAAMGDRNGYDFIQAVGSMPDDDDIAHYDFLFEFDTTPSDDEARELISQIDAKLGELNSEWKSKRDSERIAPPAIRVLPAGALASYRKQRSEAGGNDGQFKTLKLTDSPDLLDQLAPDTDPITNDK